MPLTIIPMSDNSIIIPDIKHQQSDDDDDDDNGNDKNLIKSTENGHKLLNTSLSRNTKLLSRSPSPSPRSISSGPPDRSLNQKFHVAALTGNLNTLQELVSKARATPLYFASLYHHTRIVELLLNKYKAIVDLSTFDGSTPLHVACERGFTDIVQLLINSQANINAKMNDGTTAIMLACQNGHLSVVQMLIATEQCNINIQRLDGITPLFLIIQNGHETIFDYMIDNIDNINNIKETIDLAREDGATPLFKACQKGYESLVKKLLKYKPKLELLKNGESCLHAATMFNHASIVQMLIDNGANPLLNNWEGMTAVDLAKEAQLKDIMDILMKALAPKLSEHARQYLLHKSTRRTDADFDLDLVEHEERDEWKLYKSLKSAAELERLEEEIEQTPVLPDISTTKGKQTGSNRQKSMRPHRYHTTSQK
ncbi:unnamed protein product [Rotaria sp. Silwood1]|nr:unnamed protein product [Rotaria sp. Silwood1]